MICDLHISGCATAGEFSLEIDGRERSVSYCATAADIRDAFDVEAIGGPLSCVSVYITCKSMPTLGTSSVRGTNARVALRRMV